MKTIELQLQSFSHTLKELFTSLSNPGLPKKNSEGIYSSTGNKSEKEEGKEDKILTNQNHLDMILKEVREELEAQKRAK